MKYKCTKMNQKIVLYDVAKEGISYDAWKELLKFTAGVSSFKYTEAVENNLSSDTLNQLRMHGFLVEIEKTYDINSFYIVSDSNGVYMFSFYFIESSQFSNLVHIIKRKVKGGNGTIGKDPASYKESVVNSISFKNGKVLSRDVDKKLDIMYTAKVRKY